MFSLITKLIYKLPFCEKSHYSQKNVHFLRAILSVKCLQDKYVCVFYGHVCLLILFRFFLKKGILFLLFLPNISYPSPNRTFSFENMKNIWISLEPDPILICKSDLQQAKKYYGFTIVLR